MLTWTLGQESTSLSSERHTTNSSYGSLASSADNALTTKLNVVRQAPQKGTTRERCDDRSQTTPPPPCGGRTADYQRAADPSGDVWGDGWWGEPRIIRPTRKELGPMSIIAEDLRVFQATEGSTESSTLLFGAEALLWPRAAEKSGK